MTLKDLILKYEFDTVVPDLLTVDEPIKDNLYAFKEAFDTLRRMAPGDAQGEQIVVSLEVETEEDGTEIERYLHASNCEGDLWESSLAKEVVIEADITEIRALAQILWHIFGFTPKLEGYQYYETKNKYERVGKIQRLIDSIVATSWDSDYADYKYLFDTKELYVFEFYSRTTSKETRAQYIVDNFVKYFNEDLTQYKRTDMVISSGEEHGVTFLELQALREVIFPRAGEVDGEDPGYIVHFTTEADLGDDLHVRLICSR